MKRRLLRKTTLTRLLAIITAALAGLPSTINHGAQSRVAAPLSFQRVEIDAQPPDSPYVKLAGDFNDDGRLDIAIGGAKGPLVWYVNPGWRRVPIAEGGWQTVGGTVGDVDGDGDPDTVPGAQVWFENPRPKGDPAKDPWPAHRISAITSHDAMLADLDRDGRRDLVARDQSGFNHNLGNTLHFWRQAAPDRWQHHTLECPHGEGLALADLDRDGDLDILIGGCWFENPGRIATDWPKHVVATTGSHDILTGDFNGDGRPDILGANHSGTYQPVELWLNQTAKSTAHGPLRVHLTNPRYFTDDGQRAVYLTGSHTWDNLQDMGETDPPAAFDFNAYLDWLAEHDHNFIRLWRWELVSWDTRANNEKTAKRLLATPHPWARSGPGQAWDGKPKFNLDQFNEAYFQRLRSRVAAARDRGIFVSVMLFEGWGLQHVTNAWKAHPLHADNNVNGLNGDADGDGRGLEVDTLRVPAVTKVQEAYVRKVIDTVNDLDNVLYEISNEAGAYSTDWQEHFIRFIHDHEKGKPRQHPVGMTFEYSRDPKQRGSNTNLFRSPADWISPNPDAGQFNYRTNPPPADGRKVILTDTDHLWGVGGDVAWVWKSFLRGLNPLFMDPYKQHVLQGGADSEWEPVRRAMGVTRRLADRVNLAAMTPRGELAGSGYCLANPANEYLVYLPAGGEVNVDLSGAAGEFQVEWIHPVEGNRTPDGSAGGGATRTFKAPGSGGAVLHLRSPK